MKTLKHTAAFLILAATLGAAPAQQRLPQAQPDGIPVTSMSRLRALSGDARQFNEQSRLQYAQLLGQAKEQGALVPDSHPQVQRLRAIARRLIPYTARWNPAAAQWNWQVNLVNSPQVNAFCMPGGRIAFFSGILTKLNLTDDEVAMVMGHEIAHALREHAREQVGKTAATSLFTRLAGAGLTAYFGVDPRLGDVGSDLVTKGMALKYSRDDEREADLVGMDVAARAGFDPRAGIALWEKMGAQSRSAPPAFLSTHPSGGNRIAEMNKAMPLVLPVYARTKGMDPAGLPAYRSTPASAN